MEYRDRVFYKSCEDMAEIPDGVVQTCVTSPPYWGLRDYGVDGQIGLEETPQAYVERLVRVFREVKRVLRDDGTLWLNLGDSYCSTAPGTKGAPMPFEGRAQAEIYANKRPNTPAGMKPKDLVGIPWMVAFALRADGWYLRSDIIWHKPNPMPSSVTDRCTTSHEYIFMLSKSARYYYDNLAVAEPVSVETNSEGYAFGGNKADGYGPRTYSGNEYTSAGTRNKRDVWTVATAPYDGAHFATFPPDLIRPCILAGSSERGQCAGCGSPYQRQVELVGGRTTGRQAERDAAKARVGQANASANYGSGLDPDDIATRKTVGWKAACSCDAGVVPQLVLDPFMGSGTTAEVAESLGRDWVGYELNENYRPLIEERTRMRGLF